MKTWETLTMSRKEVPRAGLLKAALAGRISNAQGALALHLSLRQFQRVKVRFATEGARGRPQRLRGRPSPRRLAPELRAQAIALLQSPYGGLNDCHATEKLLEVEGLLLSRSSVRRLRRALGVPAKRRRRPPRGRMRRTPEAQMGALVQLDASPFAWLEDRGPALTLHGAIDDATGTGLALVFRPTEDLHGYATLLQQLCTTYGRPLALYGDRFGVFVRNDAHWTLEEQLRGTQDPTHFGRILQELGIGFIAAHSPQAKGRIERFWQTLQDRLGSELPPPGLHTKGGANSRPPPRVPGVPGRPPPRLHRRPVPCHPARSRRRLRAPPPPRAQLGSPPAPTRLSEPRCRGGPLPPPPPKAPPFIAPPGASGRTQAESRTPLAPLHPLLHPAPGDDIFTEQLG